MLLFYLFSYAAIAEVRTSMQFQLINFRCLRLLIVAFKPMAIFIDPSVWVLCTIVASHSCTICSSFIR